MATNYERAAGTPEKLAKLLAGMCLANDNCEASGVAKCPLALVCDYGEVTKIEENRVMLDESELTEWLRREFDDTENA